MEPFSNSSGVKADYSGGDAASPLKKKTTTTRPSVAKAMDMRFVILGVLVGASLWQMRKDKSSYINTSIAGSETTLKKTTLAAPKPSSLFHDIAETRKRQKELDSLDAVSAFDVWTRPFWNQTTGTITAATDNVTTNNHSTAFVFPNVDFRIHYYMGSWYDKRLNKANCSHFDKKFLDGKWGSKMHNQDILYSYDGLTKQIRTSQHWNVGNYLAFYQTVMRNSTTPKNAVVAMCVGDASSVKAEIPVAAKTRKAGFLQDPYSENGYYGIIWPLNMVRHFGPVNDYLELERVGNVTAWEDKKEAMIWRGGFTGIPLLLKGAGFRNSTHEYGPRVQAVLEHCFKNQSQIDVAFVNIPPKQNGIPKPVNKTLMENCMRDNHTSMQDQLEFKYILNVEGNDVSSGLKWQLASNSVVFMAKPMTVSWAMEEQLIPFYHYIPVDRNFENLDKMLEWAKTHDDEAKKIAQQATQYMHDLWISAKAQRDHAELHTLLATRYQDQFSEALWECLPSKSEKIQIRNSNNHARSSLILVNRSKKKKQWTNKKKKKKNS